MLPHVVRAVIKCVLLRVVILVILLVILVLIIFLNIFFITRGVNTCLKNHHVRVNVTPNAYRHVHNLAQIIV